MSKSYLGRAIIECGRGKHGKFERKRRASAARRWTLDADGEYKPGPHKGDRVELRDDLTVLHNWLKSCVGRPWNDVYSEFCAREDKRTLRGDHVHRHFKEMVRGSGGRESPLGSFLSYNYGFFVDGNGLLAYVPRRRWRVNPDYARAQAWAAGRKVVTMYGALYWAKRILLALGPDTPAWHGSASPLPERWKVMGRMSRADEAVWFSFDSALREKHTHRLFS